MLYLSFPEVEQFGLARFRTWKVLELDSGIEDDAAPSPGLVRVSRRRIEGVLGRMAVVVPIRNERVKFLEGVLSGIPRGVETIVISNSSRHPVDRFLIEREAIEGFARATGRRVTLVHQRDGALGRGLVDAGYEGLLDEQQRVAHGKGESMAVGILLALAEGADYVGFLDADNFVPGAVLEHVWNYAAGFATIGRPTVCVRDVWHSKPKVRAGIVFNRGGRVSRITNEYLNLLLAQHTGFETDSIRSGNAGEHALSAPLALRMPLASSFAVETWELRWMLEQWGGALDVSTEDAAGGVDVLQIETRNPHFHEEKGDEHLAGMIADSLGVLFHSPLATDDFKRDVLAELERAGWRGAPPAPKVLPAPDEGEVKVLASWMVDGARELVLGPPDRR